MEGDHKRSESYENVHTLKVAMDDGRVDCVEGNDSTRDLISPLHDIIPRDLVLSKGEVRG